jgi:hypothetical protein
MRGARDRRRDHAPRARHPRGQSQDRPLTSPVAAASPFTDARSHGDPGPPSAGLHQDTEVHQVVRSSPAGVRDRDRMPEMPGPAAPDLAHQERAHRQEDPDCHASVSGSAPASPCTLAAGKGPRWARCGRLGELSGRPRRDAMGQSAPHARWTFLPPSDRPFARPWTDLAAPSSPPRASQGGGQPCPARVL